MDSENDKQNESNSFRTQDFSKRASIGGGPEKEHRSETLDRIIEKIQPNAEKMAEHLSAIRNGKRIVFTNGCFDLIHRGHIEYLARARDAGDYLVLAINADASVSRLKGPSRPINSLAERMLALAALGFVDGVTSFEEDTPERAISIIRPDIHVKGGDYKEEDLPEARVVRSYGGQVQLIPFVEGYSTTAIIQRMG